MAIMSDLRVYILRSFLVIITQEMVSFLQNYSLLSILVPERSFVFAIECKRDADGYYWIVGRVDDCINVSGHLLSTAEIESALVEHGAVSEAAVVSIYYLALLSHSPPPEFIPTLL